MLVKNLVPTVFNIFILITIFACQNNKEKNFEQEKTHEVVKRFIKKGAQISLINKTDAASHKKIKDILRKEFKIFKINDLKLGTVDLDADKQYFEYELGRKSNKSFVIIGIISNRGAYLFDRLFTYNNEIFFKKRGQNNYVIYKNVFETIDSYNKIQTCELQFDFQRKKVFKGLDEGIVIEVSKTACNY